MGINKPLVVIASILTAIMLTLTIVSLVIGMDQPHPEANVITQEFMEEYAHWMMWKTLGSITMTWTFIGAVLIVVGIAWGVIDYRNDFDKFIRYNVLIIAVIVTAISVPKVSIFDVGDMAKVTPRAHKVSITKTYYEDVRRIFTRHRSSTTRHYYIAYSNGIKEEVGYYEYEKYSAGKEYYLIMCNNTIVGRFDTDIYTIK